VVEEGTQERAAAVGSWNAEHHSERQTFNSQDSLPQYSYHLESLLLVSSTPKVFRW
jgi:hypothetical protein